MANERARELRKNQTSAERILWRGLQKRQVLNCRFRRQHPMGEYIVDFVCLERKLIIELDGEHHGEAKKMAHDVRRDKWLEASGYHVVRFWNREIYSNLDGVLTTIAELLQREGKH